MNIFNHLHYLMLVEMKLLGTRIYTHESSCRVKTQFYAYLGGKTF